MIFFSRLLEINSVKFFSNEEVTNSCVGLNLEIKMEKSFSNAPFQKVIYSHIASKTIHFIICNKYFVGDFTFKTYVIVDGEIDSLTIHCWVI